VARWPAGLHLAAGSVRAVGQRPRRADPTPQHHYWRHVDTELHATGQTGFNVGAGASSVIQASAGPTATGEVWSVDLVQVQINFLYGAQPLVVQQIEAQQTGVTTTPPPPIVAQVWLASGGTRLHLLAQTSQGGYDNIGLGGQQVRPGDQLTVLWFIRTLGGAIFNTTGWFMARGTKRTLSAL